MCIRDRLEGVRTETIVHRAKDVAKLQEELKDMGEDEDFEYKYEEDADDPSIWFSAAFPR